MNESRWYVIHAYSGFEQKVADSIKEQSEKLGLSQLIEEISVPKQEFGSIRIIREQNMVSAQRIV